MKADLLNVAVICISSYNDIYFQYKAASLSTPL